MGRGRVAPIKAPGQMSQGLVKLQGGRRDMKKFTGYGPGWNRCECGLPLRRTNADNLVHRYPIHGQRMHDLVMRKKAEAAVRATS